MPRSMLDIGSADAGAGGMPISSSSGASGMDASSSSSDASAVARSSGAGSGSVCLEGGGARRGRGVPRPPSRHRGWRGCWPRPREEVEAQPFSDVTW